MADSALSPDSSSSSSDGTSEGSPPSPPSTNEGLSPPVSQSSPPSISPPSPPASTSDSSSSPPSGFPTTNTPPPESPPSSDSSSQPPPNSNNSPPSPPSDSSSSSSSPPPQTLDPPLNTPDQSSSPQSNSPPALENSPPSPPLSPPAANSSPVPTAPQSSPIPPGTDPSESSPTPPTPTTPMPGEPPSEISRPNPVPPTQTTPSDPFTPNPPASRSSNRVPEISPPSTRSHSSSSHSSTKQSSDSNDNSGYGMVIGVSVAGVAIIALIALVFVIRKKKKRRAEAFPDFYRPNPLNFSGKSEGYYYRQAGVAGNASHSDSYYAMNTAPSPSALGNSFGGSYRHGYPSGPPDTGGIGSSKSWFSYEELMDITNGFARQNILGEGGFGCVYKGKLQDGREVAVKQLKAGSGQGEREFRAEVEIISRVHHKHLVSLVGYCIADHHRLLVYEFVPNNTLEHHLHGKGNPTMEWPKRMKIAIGAARGLAYLHEDCHPRIIHRDIKSANILLDDAFEAQVADFGLAKLSNDINTHVSTRVMGTFGYMAPEYASSGKLTDRSDVFSFGVVLLELVTGRKPVDASQPLGDESLVEWARPLLIRALDTGNFDELADPKLENIYVVGEMFRMVEAAAACVRHSAPKRLRMVQVVRALDTEGDMPDLTNGVKFGQSTVFEPGQYPNDIQKFRRMAFGSSDYSSEYGNSGEHDMRSTSSYSGEYQHNSDPPPRIPNQWRPGDNTSSEYTSGNESETRAMNRRPSDSAGSRRHGGR